ncbi:MAG: Uncharacterised protein [Bacteroidota bacterium]|nr:MAG: Uncharacterised protein [Bacteroidota bacterium]
MGEYPTSNSGKKENKLFNKVFLILYMRLKNNYNLFLNLNNYVKL